MSRLDNLSQILLNSKRYNDIVHIFQRYEPHPNFDIADLISRMCTKQMYPKCEILAERKKEYANVFYYINIFFF